MNEFDYPSTTALIQRCHHYLKDCLQYWAGPGYDHNHSGYYEAADLQGELQKDLSRRLRVQARNIFSHAAGTIQGYGEFSEVAEGGFTYVKNHYHHQNGFATLVNAQGKIVDPTVYAYDHAFMLLASAWLYSLSGKVEHRQGLDDVWHFFQSCFQNAWMGIETSFPRPGPDSPRIEQNPHMHLFEALMDVFVITREESWIVEAGKIYKLYQDYFYHSEDKIIREFFNQDYSPFKAKEWVDPGHHYEWTWLLNKYERLSGEKTISLNEIFQYAETRGLGKQGLIYEFLLPSGEVVKSSHRMWSQTEQIKARLTLYERTGDLTYFNKAVESVRTLFRVFCHPDLPGIWYDCIDDEGQLITDKSPASTLYHLYIALHEFIRVGREVVDSRSD